MKNEFSMQNEHSRSWQTHLLRILRMRILRCHCYVNVHAFMQRTESYTRLSTTTDLLLLSFDSFRWDNIYAKLIRRFELNIFGEWSDAMLRAIPLKSVKTFSASSNGIYGLPSFDRISDWPIRTPNVASNTTHEYLSNQNCTNLMQSFIWKIYLNSIVKCFRVQCPFDPFRCTGAVH